MNTNPLSARKILVAACCLAAGLFALTLARAQADSLAALKISAQLAWDPVYTNDPLRVRIRLTCPQARQALALQLRQAELGLPTSNIIPPAIATNWQEGVQLSLAYVDTNQVRHEILAPDQWALYLRPILDDPPAFAGLLTARSREWLVPGPVAGLAASNYVVTVAWDGSSLADSNLLPAGGVLSGLDLSFAVLAPTNAVEQATHLGRLAFEEYMAGQSAQARADGQLALRLDPKNLDPERVETYFVVAHSALRLNDYLGGADTFQSMMQAYPSAQDEVVETARGRLNLLAPQLRVLAGAETNHATFLFQVLTLANQRYLTYGSTNLQNWLPLSTNLGTGDWIDVADTNAWLLNARFYRAVWTP